LFGDLNELLWGVCMVCDTIYTWKFIIMTNDKFEGKVIFIHPRRSVGEKGLAFYNLTCSTFYGIDDKLLILLSEMYTRNK